MRIISNLRFVIRQFAKDEAGVTAVEYGILASLIAMAIVGAVISVGTDLSGVFSSVATEIAR